jgi:hypothetical protein
MALQHREDNQLHTHRLENLKSYIIVLVCKSHTKAAVLNETRKDNDQVFNLHPHVIHMRLCAQGSLNVGSQLI